MANRISLKELSDLLALEVKNGNGDAFVFVGEYYITKDNYKENLKGIASNYDKEHAGPYIVYNDELTKEKILAINYQHVQTLTDEENAELEKLLRQEEEKKFKSSKKSSSRGYYTEFRYNADRGEIREERAPEVNPFTFEVRADVFNEQQDQ